jgi:hypothetical protein
MECRHSAPQYGSLSLPHGIYRPEGECELRDCAECARFLVSYDETDGDDSRQLDRSISSLCRFQRWLSIVGAVAAE